MVEVYKVEQALGVQKGAEKGGKEAASVPEGAPVSVSLTAPGDVPSSATAPVAA